MPGYHRRRSFVYTALLSYRKVPAFRELEHDRAMASAHDLMRRAGEMSSMLNAPTLLFLLAPLSSSSMSNDVESSPTRMCSTYNQNIIYTDHINLWQNTTLNIFLLLWDAWTSYCDQEVIRVSSLFGNIYLGSNRCRHYILSV